MKWTFAATLSVALFLPCALQAESSVVERAVARFEAPDTGGAQHPRFIFERELAFERLDERPRSTAFSP